MVKIGSKIKITATDNENYVPYLDKIWTVESIAYSKEDHPGYDECVGGPLIDCEGLPFSLYKFEFEEVYTKEKQIYERTNDFVENNSTEN